MTRTTILRPEFVKAIPDTLNDGTLYVSIEYATVAHKCCCGCGLEVVTPLSPTDWKFTYDGVSISLFPSIGNWNFKCQSHYWIDASRVVWADQWSGDMVAAGRARDRNAKANYYSGQDSATTKKPSDTKAQEGAPKTGLWGWFAHWWRK